MRGLRRFRTRPEGSAPFNGLGHPAECGPYPTGTSMEAAVGSASTVVIQGPSCSADAKLAQDMHSALAS